MMRHLFYLTVLCLAFLCQNIEAKESAGRIAENDFYYNEHNKAMMSDGSGMGDDEDDEDGSGMEPTDDEDDEDDEEGSATEMPRKQTCVDKVTEVRESGLLGAYEPRCEEDGSYSKVQCHGSIGSCWCSTMEGERIEGTTSQRGQMPNCEEMVYEYNLIVKFDLDFQATVTNEVLYKQKIKKKLMTSLTKKFKGMVLKLMINSVAPGSVIVDFDLELSGVQPKEPTNDDLKTAVEQSGVGPVMGFVATAKHEPRSTPEPTTMKTKKPMTKTPPTITIKNVIPEGEDDNEKEVVEGKPIDPEDEEIYNVVPGAKGAMDEEKEDDLDMEKKEEETNGIGFEENLASKHAASSSVFAGQPGILAGIIGGAVVGLLFAVLLVMFIVYRMRKKDEGSYALDEPKSPRLNTYTKASNKEFYA